MGTPLKVVVLDLGPPAAEMISELQHQGHDVVVVREIPGAVTAAARQGGQVLLVPGAHLAAVREARQQASISIDFIPLLAIYNTGTCVEELEAHRAVADDVLVWPVGQAHLTRRLEALARQRQLFQEARLRQVHARTIQELATTLATSIEFEDLLVDAIVRLVESACAKSCLVLVKAEDETVYYVMGSTDEPSAARLPVPAADHPEVAEVLHTRRPFWAAASLSTLGESLRQRGLGAVWVFPLHWEGEAYGVVELCFEDEAVLPEATVDMLQEASAFIAHALHGSEVFAGLREQTHKKQLSPERQRQVEVLQKYEEFFQRAYDGIIVVDRQYHVLYINPAGEQITGYARRGLEGADLLEIIAEADRSLLAGAVEQVSGKATPSFDLALITTSGDPILVSVAPSAVLADDTMVVLSFRDVTEARSLENELRSTKEFLERLIDSTVDAIVATDVDGRVILFNQGAERIFGYTSDEVVGKLGMKDLYAEGMAEKVMEHLRGPEDGGYGRLEAVRKEVLGAARELVPVLLSANLIYEDGREVGTVGIYSDLRERLRIERTLAQAQEKLIETEKQALIAELAGTTAHELNQPLTSIMGYAELLKRRVAADDSNHRAVDTILREAERMAEIVRKIGKITRYETKAYVGETQILDLEKSSE
jgi:PAS domain S-box-containing protein